MQMICLLRKSFDAMVEAEAAFMADLEKLLKNEGHMPEDKFLVMSRETDDECSARSRSRVDPIIGQRGNTSLTWAEFCRMM